MPEVHKLKFRAVILALPVIVLATFATGCQSSQPSATEANGSSSSSQSPTTSGSVPAAPAPAIDAANAAPPASQTGGFDGQKAYDFTAKLVSFGPHPSGSDANKQVQEYITSQLKSFGCAVSEDDFHSNTPIGSVAMKNIVAQIPGNKDSIILLMTHYDTARNDAQDQPISNFVGAVDGGSSTGLMLEMARNLCGTKSNSAVWIAFLDGEEAVQKWSDTDSTYGSRELAARMSLSGDLPKIKAVMLADMVGMKDLCIEKDSNSTQWLTDLVWSTAARLGYSNVFVQQSTGIEDDHLPFLHRKAPSVDVIELLDCRTGATWQYWHTAQDTMDKVSPKSLAIVGHVFTESVKEIQARK